MHKDIHDFILDIYSFLNNSIQKIDEVQIILYILDENYKKNCMFEIKCLIMLVK